MNTTVISSRSIPAPRRSAVVDFGLVSDLPPVIASRPSVLSRLAARVSERRALRAFESAVLHAEGSEQGDLLALGRRN